MTVGLEPATAGDASAIAELHAASWRSAYRDLLPASFLDTEVERNRLRLWTERMARFDPQRQLVLKAVDRDALVGFACVLLDAEPRQGALLDNLHVAPACKGQGIGTTLLRECERWAISCAASSLYLWVLADNLAARQFYEFRGGTAARTRTVELVPGVVVPEVQYVWPLGLDSAGAPTE